MREILFRGKRIIDGKWVEGSLVQGFDTYELSRRVCFIYDADNTVIRSTGFIGNYCGDEVIPETVSRLLEPPTYDNHDRGRYFEGDIVELYDRFGNPNGMAIVVDESCITENGLGRWFPQDTKLAKVVANVWDNPELVGEEYAERYKRHFGFSLKKGENHNG